MADRTDAYRGCLLGLAVGDAMGMPVDEMTWDEIRENYGPQGLLGYDLRSDFAQITSYTQVAAYICNALLLSASRGKSEKILPYVKLGLTEWTRSQQFARDPENSHCWIAKLPAFRRRYCRDARMLDTLRLAAMVAMFYNPQRLTPPQVGELTARIVQLTHGDPTAFLSAAVLAYGATGILMEPELPLSQQFSSAISATFHQFRDQYTEVYTVTEVLTDALDRAKAAEPMDAVMESLQCYSALNCMAGAIYAAVANEKDFDTAMITAVNHSGCSCAVAGITGAILGARMGYSALPDFYVESLEPVKALCTLADDMVSCTPIKGLFDEDWDRKYVQGLPLL